MTDRIVDARCAADVLDWRYKAEVLLDRRRDQVWLLRKECQLIWIVGQRQKQCANHMSSALIARNQQQHREEEQFVIAESTLLGMGGKLPENSAFPKQPVVTPMSEECTQSPESGKALHKRNQPGG
ncbi:Uncharacterised protein [Mycobacterium tuberculosis]|uniref:Uncharacterized protein n=2 Tax=Mycobacterium tuberculosis TaxID=1773 RepID=A0A916LDQ2_MYCTX|nr:Uncharacterised protein [Mycobacterium tuberculosis]COY14980.1 Uncharacterised protein [Mycobacterium tuberculosis]COY97075.1 Uncharacterised protein [Mycobacterium tuberculosis]